MTIKLNTNTFFVYPGKEFWLIGDNTSKDFIVPEKLGRRTICLANCGNNIHQQNLNKKPLPQFIIKII